MDKPCPDEDFPEELGGAQCVPRFVPDEKYALFEDIYREYHEKNSNNEKKQKTEPPPLFYNQENPLYPQAPFLFTHIMESAGVFFGFHSEWTLERQMREEIADFCALDAQCYIVPISFKEELVKVYKQCGLQIPWKDEARVNAVIKNVAFYKSLHQVSYNHIRPVFCSEEIWRAVNQAFNAVISSGFTVPTFVRKQGENQKKITTDPHPSFEAVQIPKYQKKTWKDMQTSKQWEDMMHSRNWVEQPKDENTLLVEWVIDGNVITSKPKHYRDVLPGEAAGNPHPRYILVPQTHADRFYTEVDREQ